MAVKKKVDAPETKNEPKIDARALELKTVRAELKELEKRADGLRAEILKEYKPGRYEGFVILEKNRNMLDKKLLEDKFGNLDPFHKVTSALYIEFV